MAKLEMDKTRKDKDKEFEFLMNVKINAELRLALRTKAFEQDTTISNVARDILKNALGLSEAPKKAPVKKQVRTSKERLAARMDSTKSEASKDRETKSKRATSKKKEASPAKPKAVLKVSKKLKGSAGKELIIK